MTSRRVQAWQLPATRAVRRDDPAPAGPRVTDVRITTACYEFPVVQLVLRVADEPVDARLAVLPFRLADGSDEIPHELITTLVSDYADGVPDALPEVRSDDSFRLEPGRNHSVWVNVHVPPEQTPGTYRGAVRVIAAGRGIRIPFTVEVLDFILPHTSSLPTAFDVPYADLAGQGRRDPKWCMEHLYYLQLSRRAVPTDLPIPPDVTPAEWVRLAEWYLRDDRITSYRVPFRADEPAWTRLLVGGLREHGLLGRAFFLVDESDDGDVEARQERLRATCERLDLIAPDVPRLVTAEPAPELDGCAHTWAPTPDRFDREIALVRRAAGERVWWRGGRGPGPTFSPHDDPTGVRLLSWMQQAYGVDGHVYRAADGAGALVRLGRYDQPVSTVRLVALYLGLVDYEYLRIVEDSLAEAVGRLGITDFDAHAAMWLWYHRGFTSVADYSHDAAEVDAVHDELGRQITRLRRHDVPVAVFLPATSPPATGAAFDVELFALPGTSFTVAGAEVTDVEKTASYVRGRHRLDLHPGRHEIEVQSRSGDRCDVDRYVLLVRCLADLSGSDRAIAR